jgi:uncharacterized protein YjiS (DUF1127 family)
MAGDIFDEMANCARAMAAITTRLSAIENEAPPPRDDTVARLNFAVDQLGRYRVGVRELNALLNKSLDDILAAQGAD